MIDEQIKKDLKMTTQILEHDGNFLEVAVNNKHFQFYKGSSYINVLMKNASHRVWRGLGNAFNNFTEAEKHYKSNEAQIAIQIAKEILN